MPMRCNISATSAQLLTRCRDTGPEQLLRVGGDVLPMRCNGTGTVAMSTGTIGGVSEDQLHRCPRTSEQQWRRCVANVTLMLRRGAATGGQLSRHMCDDEAQPRHNSGTTDAQLWGNSGAAAAQRCRRCCATVAGLLGHSRGTVGSVRRMLSRGEPANRVGSNRTLGGRVTSDQARAKVSGRAGRE